MSDLTQVLQDWIAIPSISGEEGDYGDAVARALAGLGLAVERQQLAPGRFNILARADEPEVVFCTHLDTVPPWIAPRADREFVHGRGACDAKGPLLAMLEATRQLLSEGERRVGFLLTVGEEVDGAGARLADSQPWSPRFTIVGEPTDNRFVRGHKGIFKADLCARGVAGHSAISPGPSALHALVGSLAALLETDWGEHPVLGAGTLNVGLLEGGVAGNVVADTARADLVLRIVEDPALVERRLRAALAPGVELTDSKGYGPVEFHLPEGAEEDAPVVAFGTDAPFLTRWGKPLLYGPGSIGDAHTDHERLSLRSLERAVHDYAATARALLTSAP